MITIEKVQNISRDKVYYTNKEKEQVSFTATLARICKDKGIDIHKLNVSEPLKKEVYERMKKI